MIPKVFSNLNDPVMQGTPPEPAGRCSLREYSPGLLGAVLGKPGYGREQPVSHGLGSGQDALRAHALHDVPEVLGCASPHG